MADLFSTGVRPLIDEYLKKKSEEVRSYGKYWSASSAGYCMRLNIMKRLGVPKVPELEDNATQTRIFEAGHIFHEWVQRITEDAGTSVAQELELQDEELMIRGHFDDLVLIERDFKTGDLIKGVVANTMVAGKEVKKQSLILYDYKTANSQAFNYKKDGIGYYHKMQLGTYMYMLRKLDEKIAILIGRPDLYELILNLLEARIMQISKDDLRMREYQLLWTPELKVEILTYWSGLNTWWAAKKLPPCTCLEHDGGFMGRRSKKGKVYNDFFYENEPCSLEWFKLWRKDNPL